MMGRALLMAGAALALIASAAHAQGQARIDPATGVIAPAPSCATVAAASLARATKPPPAPSGHMVVGNGRLQFLTAPDDRCVNTGVFTVPGDSLTVKLELGPYSLASYTNPKTHVHVEGWVHTDRIAMVVDDKE